MSWTGLPPYRNGIRVTPYYCASGSRPLRVDIIGKGGFDITTADFGDDALLGAKTSALGLTAEQVRRAA